MLRFLIFIKSQILSQLPTPDSISLVYHISACSFTPSDFPSVVQYIIADRLGMICILIKCWLETDWHQFLAFSVSVQNCTCIFCWYCRSQIWGRNFQTSEFYIHFSKII